MKTFKFPEFFDKHFSDYGAWRRALMVNTARAFIYFDRKDAFAENPADEFLQTRYASAIYSMGLDMGGFGNKFDKWVCTIPESERKFWYDMVVEAFHLNKGRR